MIELRNVSKVYNNFNDNYITALRGVNLKLAKTGLTFIVGPSGSGKSTLLNILSGVDVPTSGEMLVNGVSTAQFNSKGLDGYRNNYVGIVYQDYNLLDHLTLGQNVALQLEIQGKTCDPAELSAMFEKLGIGGMEDRYPTQCSGGQCQRAAIARVLIKKPTVLFADEPTAAVDQEQRLEIYKLMRELSKEILIIASTHSVEMVDRFADRILTIQNGQVVGDTIAGDDKSSSEVFGNSVMAIEPGVTLNYEDIDRLNKLIKANNSKGSKGVFLCVENDAEKVEKMHPVAAKEMHTALKSKQKQKMAQRETRIKQINEEATGVFQFEATRLPVKSAWGMSVLNLRSNKLRSVFTILLSVLAVTFFALSSNMSGLNESRAVISSFSASNANYLTVESKNELFTKTAKSYWIDKPDSSEDYDKTSLVFDFGPSLTMMPSSWSLPEGTQISAVSKLAVVNKDRSEERGGKFYNMFGHSLKQEADGAPMGRWPVAYNEIVVSDFIVAQMRTALFAAKGRNLAGVPDYRAFYDEYNRSGVSVVELELGSIRYKIVGIYETNFEHYFEFEDIRPGVFFKVDNRGYFDVQEMLRLKKGLNMNERKQAEYLMSHDFVTGYVTQSFVDRIYDGSSVGALNDVFYGSTGTAVPNIIVGNNFMSVGAGSYYMTMHPNGYEMDVASSAAPGLYSKIFGPNADAGLQIARGSWVGSTESIRVSRGFYVDILGGKVNSAGTSADFEWSPAKNRFTPTFAKRNIEYVSMNNSQTVGNPDEEIVAVPVTQSYDVLWSHPLVVDNIGLNGFVGELNTDDYIIQFSSEALYNKFVELLVLPSTSFIISNNYNESEVRTVLANMERDIGSGSGVTVSYSDADAIREFVAKSDETASVMLTVSIVFGVFAVCLMYSYIFSSVRSKRRSIGIIRSLGARSRDVMWVFLLEALIVSALVVLGSFVTIALSATIANLMIQKSSAYSIVMFDLNFMFFFTIFAATLAVILACYLIPSLAFARHKKNRGLIKDIQALSDN